MSQGVSCPSLDERELIGAGQESIELGVFFGGKSSFLASGDEFIQASLDGRSQHPFGQGLQLSAAETDQDFRIVGHRTNPQW